MSEMTAIERMRQTAAEQEREAVLSKTPDALKGVIVSLMRDIDKDDPMWGVVLSFMAIANDIRPAVPTLRAGELERLLKAWPEQVKAENALLLKNHKALLSAFSDEAAKHAEILAEYRASAVCRKEVDISRAALVMDALRRLGRAIFRGKP